MISFLRNHVFHNFGLKLLSLAIAVVLWLAVVRDPTSEVVVTIPVQFNNVPANLDLSSEHVPQAQIRVRGPERILRDLDQQDVRASLDLAKATPGEHTYDLTVRQIHTPRGIEVLQIIPAQFRITFDKEVTRMVPVRPRVIGTLASGVQFAPGGIIADPEQVAITGPEKRVDHIESVLTDPVDATGVVGRGTFTTNVFVPDPLVQLVNRGPIHVTVITDKVPMSASGRTSKH